ncbi:MAG: tetratricopeptide repeat protein [Chthonomonadales bacterium]|nr:tetratricopeptide repeat protein [Chthonomonadales bacterium]
MISGSARHVALAILAYAISWPVAPSWAQDAPQESRTQQAYTALQKGDLPAAEAGFRAALEINRRDIAAHVGLAQVLARLGKTEEAVTSQRNAVALNPLSVDIRMGLAPILQQAGRDLDAIAELARCMTYAPGDPRPMVAMVSALQRLSRFSDARAVGLRALGIAPDVPAVHQALAELAGTREDWSEAIAHYEAAIRLQPSLQPLRVAHLGALSNAGNHARARDIARALLVRVPDDVDIRMALASALEGLHDRDAAIAEYGKVLEQAPSLAVAWGNLGWTQYGAGKLQEALASSRKALEIDASLAYVRFNLGLILAVLGQWAEAESEYGKAIAAGDSADLKAGLADVEAALKARPDDPNLQRARELLGAALAAARR